MIKCNVCNGILNNKIYDNLGSTSITSVCTTAECPTEVYYCNDCGHVQTLEMPDEFLYYDETYNFLTESEDEDQIYVIENDDAVYRTQHQVTTLLSKLDLSDNICILDYGCAKSSTMRELTRRDASITPYLFDISERYTSYWKDFIEEGNYATYEVPETWSNKFHVVTSFFSLEHISKLNETLQNIRRVLVEDGLLYAIIPNTQTNPADLIVVDHPNHFTRASLERLFFNNGLSVQEIDDTSHRGAYVVVVKKTTSVKTSEKLSVGLEKEIKCIADFWKSAATRVKEFEKAVTGKSSAIYGAGFYGTFLASNLKSIESVKFFVDQNPFLQGTTLLDRPIISPADLSNDINIMYVALNPKHSEKIIKDIKCFSYKSLSYFYI